MMRISPILLAVAVLGLSADVMADTLAVVNGQSITSAQVDAANPAAAKDPALTQKILQTLINREVLLQQAKKEGLDQTPTFQKAVAAEKDNLLIDATLHQYQTQHPVTEKALQAHYDALIKTAPKQQYRLREIQVSSYAQAKEVMGDLKKGQDFSALAAALSTGPHAVLGGELGWVASTQLSAPILAVIQKAKTGEVVGPISTPSGYVIVQNMGERPAVVLPLKDVSAQLHTELTNQDTATYLQKLRERAHIQITLAPARKPTAVK